MPRRILIVGGDSEIATAAAAHLRASGYVVAATTRRPECVALDRPFLDLSRPVGDWPIPDGISAVCFCAAIARLNDCANNPEGSALINVTRTIGLADKLLARLIPVLFLSTDKVFDGTRAQVPAATPPCPASEYGRQKAAAEGVECSVLHVHTVKPLDTDALLRHARGCKLIVTVEEHTLVGGLGSAVVDALVEHLPGATPPIKRLGIPDAFAHKYGSQDDLMEIYGLQPPQIAKTVRDGLCLRAA